MRLVPIALALLAAAAAVGCNAQPKSSAGPQVVQVTVTDAGFVPARAEVERGQAFTLVVTRTTDQTCATEIDIPTLKVHRALPLNEAVRIEVPAGVADSLGYTCGMQMFGGTIAAR